MESIKDFFCRLIVWFFLALCIGAAIVGKSYGGTLVLQAPQGDRVVLEETKCTSPVAGAFKPELGKTKNATYVYREKVRRPNVPGCYIEHMGAYFMFFEDGDAYMIPKDQFKPGDASAKRTGRII